MRIEPVPHSQGVASTSQTGAGNQLLMHITAVFPLSPNLRSNQTCDCEVQHAAC